MTWEGLVLKCGGLVLRVYSSLSLLVKSRSQNASFACSNRLSSTRALLPGSLSDTTQWKPLDRLVNYTRPGRIIPVLPLNIL